MILFFLAIERKSNYEKLKEIWCTQNRPKLSQESHTCVCNSWLFGGEGRRHFYFSLVKIPLRARHSGLIFWLGLSCFCQYGCSESKYQIQESKFKRLERFLSKLQAKFTHFGQKQLQRMDTSSYRRVDLTDTNGRKPFSFVVKYKFSLFVFSLSVFLTLLAVFLQHYSKFKLTEKIGKLSCHFLHFSIFQFPISSTSTLKNTVNFPHTQVFSFEE